MVSALPLCVLAIALTVVSSQVDTESPVVERRTFKHGKPIKYVPLIKKHKKFVGWLPHGIRTEYAEVPVVHEGPVRPLYKFHRYQGIEVKPVTEFPETIVESHSSDYEHGFGSDVAFPSPAPVFLQDKPVLPPVSGPLLPPPVFSPPPVFAAPPPQPIVTFVPVRQPVFQPVAIPRPPIVSIPQPGPVFASIPAPIPQLPAPAPLPQFSLPAPAPLPQFSLPAQAPLPQFSLPAPAPLPQVSLPAPTPLPQVSLPSPTPIPVKIPAPVFPTLPSPPVLAPLPSLPTPAPVLSISATPEPEFPYPPSGSPIPSYIKDISVPEISITEATPTKVVTASYEEVSDQSSLFQKLKGWKADKASAALSFLKPKPVATIQFPTPLKPLPLTPDFRPPPVFLPSAQYLPPIKYESFPPNNIESPPLLNSYGVPIPHDTYATPHDRLSPDASEEEPAILPAPAKYQDQQPDTQQRLSQEQPVYVPEKALPTVEATQQPTEKAQVEEETNTASSN